MVEITEEVEEVTQEEAEENPELRADEKKAKEGVLDDEDPATFEALELEAAEESHTCRGRRRKTKLGVRLRSNAPSTERADASGEHKKGMREHPKASNDNKYSRYFGFGKQFWCADFVAFCLDMTGNRDKKVPWGYPSAVKNITAWGKKNGKIDSQPQKGDIFTRKDGMHTGFVLSAQGSRFMTIEGNTSGPWWRFLRCLPRIPRRLRRTVLLRPAPLAGSLTPWCAERLAVLRPESTLVPRAAPVSLSRRSRDA